jgi:hypothetical protein
MVMKRLNKIFSGRCPIIGIAMAVIMILNLSGCTAIGFGIGSEIDNNKPDYGPVNEGKLDEVGHGRKIVVELNDSTRVLGKFVGLVKDTGDDYRQRYSRIRAELAQNIYLPPIGDTVDFRYASGSSLKGIFEGFDQKFPCSPCSTYVSIRPWSDEGLTREKLQFLPYLRKALGDSAETVGICRLIREGKIPLMSRITIVNADKLENYSLEKVKKVQLKNGKSAKWIGLGLGLAIDISLAALFIALNNMEIMGGGSWGG